MTSPCWSIGSDFASHTTRSLICEVIALTLVVRTNLWTQRGFIRFLIARAIVANICFCAGPVVDGYARRIGLRGRGPTALLFGLGTLVSVAAAFFSVLMFNVGHLD